MLMIVSRTGIRTFLHSPSSIVATYAFLQIIVYSMWCSLGGYRTLHYNVQYFLKKMNTTAEKKAGFPAKLNHSLACALNSIQRTQERFKRDFNCSFRKDCERLRSGDYVFLDLSDGVTETSKPGHVVEGTH